MIITQKLRALVKAEAESHAEEYFTKVDKYLFAESVIDVMKMDGKFIVEHISDRQRSSLINYFEEVCEDTQPVS